MLPSECASRHFYFGIVRDPLALKMLSRLGEGGSTSIPVPTAAPCTMAMEGMRSSNSYRWKRLEANWRVRRFSADSDWIQSRSRPALKCGPSALITTTLTDVLCAHACRQATISVSMSGDSALRRSGRLSVSQPIRSVTSARIMVNAGSSSGGIPPPALSSAITATC